MKISSETITILNSFSSINKSIVIERGNVIKTRPVATKSLVAKAIVNETFPVDFAIYELRTFLSLLSLFDDPDFEFGEKMVTVTDSGNARKAVFRYAEKENLIYPPYDKDYKFPEVDASFNFTASDMANILKSAATLKMPDVAFYGDGENLYVKTFNSNLPLDRQEEDSFSIRIGETDRKFNMIFATTDFNFLKKDYDVELSFKGLAKFESDNMTYWSAPSSKSSYSK